MKADNGYVIGGNGGRSLKLLGDLPENFRFETELTSTDEIGDFGILLRADTHADRYYAVKFEPKYNRMAFDRMPRRDSTVHIQVDTERLCPIVPGEKNKLLVIAEGSVLEVYVNDKIAMSARMFDFKDGKLGLYAQNTYESCPDEVQLDDFPQLRRSVVHRMPEAEPYFNDPAKKKLSQSIGCVRRSVKASASECRLLSRIRQEITVIAPYRSKKISCRRRKV